VNILGLSIPRFVLLEGVFTGLNFGLLALGFVLIYRTNRVLNFAQGQLGVLAAVFLVKLHIDFGVNYWFALILSLGLAAVVAAISELGLRRIFNRSRVLVMVATIGLSQVFIALAALPFIRPKNVSSPFPVPITWSFTIDKFIFSPGEVLTLIVAPIIAIAVAAFVRFSSWGLAMRSMSENVDSTRLAGVWVRRTSTVTWILAGVLSGFAAILYAPGQTSVLFQPLSPDLLVLALTAALMGAMVNLTVAFVSGVLVGVIYEIVEWNFQSTSSQQLILFALLIVVMVVRVAALRKGTRGSPVATWLSGAVTVRRQADSLRAKVSIGGTLLAVLGAASLPLVLSTSQTFLFSQVCVFAVIALSLTILTGWAGQVSLGQFGLVAVGTLMAAHLGSSVPLVVLIVFGGAVTGAVAVIIGLPALRIPGLYLAVVTVAFALLMEQTVLATSCINLPIVHKRICTGLPNPTGTLIPRPDFFGLSLFSERAFAWFALGFLIVSVLAVRVWRDHGVARRLVSVRDNELGAAAIGTPVMRTKLLAFALSGFLAGAAGVCYGFAFGRVTTDTFDPTVSFTVISMVVIGGLGSIPGSILGAIYLIGLPAIFGTTSTIEFLTSGVGLLAFILYLPGGLAKLLERFGDLCAAGLRRLIEGPPDEDASEAEATEAMA
jgi:ABC-type branched-subunit amino acid transport system permease subunit